ncbi:MAG: cytochrome c oxidase accessory protein CcoG [Hyphomicrobium sp.]|nr:cytochrome c oxidase accessory protein CcoG [Hyphomicrobium sp.]
MTAMENPGQFKPEDFLDEAAPGVTRHDVEAVRQPKAKKAVAAESSDPKSAWAAKPRIYSKLARGNFRNAKWIVMLVTLGIYYLLPWIRFDRGEGLPNQFFLIDFANQRLLLGPIEIWAQEFYYITGLLIISALGLFLVTAVAGRVWCGYACPQTVWTDLMIAVERFWLGDRNAHMRLDQQGWTFEKTWKKTATHLSWLLIGLLTGGALVFYFRDAPTLAMELLNGTAPTVAYVFVAIFTLSTYLLGGIAREQVCIYMCPWPRIQGAMLDHDSLWIAYRDVRGEPRGPHKKGQTWDGRGDCVDCKACVAVCPMGIDIRNGAQLECIQCALCIDACNDIMDKVGRPRGLIAYTTERNLHTGTAGPRDGFRLVRPRTILYSIVIAITGSLMLWAMLSRSNLDVSVLPDRNPLFVRLSDGGIRNGYTVKIVNKSQVPRRFKVEVNGIDGLKTTFIGHDDIATPVEVGPSNVKALKVFASLPKDRIKSLASDSTPLTITVTEADGAVSASRDTTFRSPAP